MMQNHGRFVSSPQSLGAILGLVDFCARSLSTGKNFRKLPLFEMLSVLTLKADFFLLTLLVYMAFLFGDELISFDLTTIVCVLVSAWMALLDTQLTNI